ncbi:hypothetical protein O1O_29104, partial [Pseudomonas aeruginosa MPAO1/P1]
MSFDEVRLLAQKDPEGDDWAECLSIR